MNAVAKHQDHQDVLVRADPMVAMIERVVMNADADLDKLERMLAMKERMDAQNARISFANALSSARADIPAIIKNAQVDFTSQKGRTNYKYETLSGIAKQIDPILSNNGISYRFRTAQDKGVVTVTCIIQHRDGHSEETTLSGSPDQSGNKNGFQAVGSAVTYLQRYTLKAALGLSAEADDDGHAAAPTREQQNQRKEEPKQQGPKPVDMSRRADNMIAALKINGVSESETDEFERSLVEMRKADAQSAARVDAEIETQKHASTSYLDDEIQY